MRIRTPILLMLIVMSCTQTERTDRLTTRTSQSSDTSGVNSSIVDHPVDPSRNYADGIITGKILPSDNDQTFAWLDSLQSNDADTRNYAFRVYKAMVIKSDGALSEAICGYIKDYLYSYPQEFLVNYSSLTEEEKLQTLEFIAFEFTSGGDLKKDLDEYFTSIHKRCQCTPGNITNLKTIKAQVEVNAQRMED